ncbi:hypothetical protein [Bradyrhizobium sp. CCBAU 51627]|uniref:hypothetical protein n=1 Tax=Bradyrhizobium sp. CCBAU 51627 TaxID=1325088 RepID=UPI0023067CEE|nr:hypothetical protein [Bradyrhizobium sp. CCBAU 51627]
MTDALTAFDTRTIDRQAEKQADAFWLNDRCRVPGSAAQLALHDRSREQEQLLNAKTAAAIVKTGGAAKRMSESAATR